MNIACICPSVLFDYCRVVATIATDLVEDDLEFHRFLPHEGELPGDLDDVDALVVTGSKYHVYDPMEWIVETEDVALDALRTGIPVLGICFGHQLLADALGGTVENMDDRELGYSEVHLTAEGQRDPLFQDVPETFLTFTSHEDRVETIPEGTVLAENEYGIQAFRSDRYPGYGIQFHPEFNLDMAHSLLEEKDLTEDEAADFSSGFTEENFERSRVSRRVLRNFFEIARGE